MKKILLIEDDEILAEGLKYSLEKEEFLVTIKVHKNEIMKLNFNDYDLILLDVILPDIDGYSLYKLIREKSNKPIIFLTAKDEEEDISYSFNIGCDDYITKPFKIGELIARVKRCINMNSNYIYYKNIKIDIDGARVYIDNKELEMTVLEFKILVLLLSNRNKVLTRNFLIDEIYNYTQNYVNDNTLTVYIKRIREKLAQDDIIKTIRGIGYRVDD